MKLKTNRGAAKRIRVTGGGKLKKGAFGRHIMRAKNAKQKRGIKKTQYVHSANISNTERLLPNR